MIEEAAPSKGTILLVDDEPSIRESIAGILSDEGFKVLTAETHDDAKRIYAEHKDKIKLIITDNHRGRGYDNAGLDFIQYIRAEEALQQGRKRIPIILCSGYHKSESASLYNRVLIRGGDALLSKPPSYKELIDTVEEVIKNPLSARASRQ